MALIKRSAGSRLAFCGGERHHSKAPMIPKLLMTLSQNGAPMLILTMMRPPNAGPTARLMLTPTLFAAIACGRSARGTSWGTIDCHAGVVRAPAASIIKDEDEQYGGRHQLK